MNTIKITEAELNRKIAEHASLGPHVHEYCQNLNVAVNLMEELEYPSLEPCRYAETWRIYFDSKGYRLCRAARRPAWVICLAWLQWKEGIVYEVIEDGK